MEMNEKGQNKSIFLAAVLSMVLFLMTALAQNARWVSHEWGDNRPAWSEMHMADAAGDSKGASDYSSAK
ncbi:MAG TPA: hypothetical protein PK878_15640 [bacterium]|nr:hypothetical protein [Candidatus Omnitrophota bacterium]HOJ61716.1 hypothetical protein [bacterium]HOL93972.1 hypothetical protein [bacterium]HPO99192.1 hypothetical protein [bacterium]HXK93449.1 hypothetical protein [bacterium]